MARPLAYFKAFHRPDSDTKQVKALFGMLSFGMLCAGPEYDILDVLGWPHKLRCLMGDPNARRGILGVIMVGDGDTWTDAIRGGLLSKVDAVHDWAVSCYRQFGKHDLSEYIGAIRPSTGGHQLLLEN